MVLAAGTVRFQAVLFDLDGVLTATAASHEAAWKETFDAFLEAPGRAHRRSSFVPFTADDYLRYVDGKLREDGVRSFLHSRGIELPESVPSATTRNRSAAWPQRKNRLDGNRSFRPDTSRCFPARWRWCARCARAG